MATEVTVPTLGESITEATLGQWLKKPGEAVKADEPIASLETDKVAVEVPAPVAGIMGDYVVELGATVEVGAVIAIIEDSSAAGETTQVEERKAPQPAEQAKSAPAPAPASTASDESGDSTTTLSPAVRRAVLEHGIDPSQVKGTGKDGRLTKEDVLAAAKAAVAFNNENRMKEEAELAAFFKAQGLKVYKPDVDAFRFGGSAGRVGDLRVEADDDRVRGGGEHDVVVGDVAGALVEDVDPDLLLVQLIERVGDRTQ